MTALRRISVLGVGLWLVVAGIHAQRAAFPTATPESVGFSAAGIKALEQGVQDKIDARQLAGAVTMLARHGKLVEQRTYGMQDIASNTPMAPDTIFRIYSMTKPITGVAMMILYEEGKWRPTDPIAKHIPEFADLKVFAGAAADGSPRLEAPAHAPTVGELMSHTAGFTYGVFGNSPVDKMYQQVNPLGAPSLKAFIDMVAKLPLAYQPGEGWVYSVSVDVQGYLVEKLSGKPFPDFVRDRILMPLGMSDTAFYVPQQKLARLATIYVPDGKGGLAPVPRDANVSTPPGLPSGGGGMYSTAGDYLRFAQMLLNGGTLEETRVLSRASVDLMRMNHLPERLMNGKFGIGFYRMQPGLGFGYDFAVFDDPSKFGSPAGKGSYMWDGVAGTWFWIDPTNDLVFIGMIQRMMTSPGMPNMEDLSRTLVYAALTDPKK